MSGKCADCGRSSDTKYYETEWEYEDYKGKGTGRGGYWKCRDREDCKQYQAVLAGNYGQVGRKRTYTVFMGRLLGSTPTGYMLYDLVPTMEFVRDTTDKTHYQVLTTGTQYRPISSYREGIQLRESSSWTDRRGKLQPVWEANSEEFLESWLVKPKKKEGKNV